MVPVKHMMKHYEVGFGKCSALITMDQAQGKFLNDCNESCQIEIFKQVEHCVSHSYVWPIETVKKGLVQMLEKKKLQVEQEEVERQKKLEELKLLKEQ